MYMYMYTHYVVHVVYDIIIVLVYIQEKGHPFLIDGQSRTIFGTIATISADNPASCALGGFKESTSAYRMCKQCMATRTDAAEKVSVF